MNVEQQTNVLSTLIEQFIANSIRKPDAIALLDQWKAFPLKTSPHFIRILYEACKVGNLAIVKYFQENYHMLIDQPNVRGESPLFIATRHNNIQIVKYLMECTVNVTALTSTNDTFLHYLLCCPISKERNEIVDDIITRYNQQIFAKNSAGETPLHIAALFGDSAVVKKLIECGAKPTDKTTRAVDVYEYSLVS